MPEVDSDVEDGLYRKGGVLYAYSRPWYTLHKKLRALGYPNWDTPNPGDYGHGYIWVTTEVGVINIGHVNRLVSKNLESLQKILDTEITSKFEIQSQVYDAWKAQKLKVSQYWKARYYKAKQTTSHLLGRLIKQKPKPGGVVFKQQNVKVITYRPVRVRPVNKINPNLKDRIGQFIDGV